MHIYEVRPRKDHHGVDLISDALPFGRLWYDTPDNAIGYAIHSSRSHAAVIRVYDEAGNVTQTQEHNADFKEWRGGMHFVSRRSALGCTGPKPCYWHLLGLFHSLRGSFREAV